MSKLKKNRQNNGRQKKDEQTSTKHYTESRRSSNKNHTNKYNLYIVLDTFCPDCGYYGNSNWNNINQFNRLFIYSTWDCEWLLFKAEMINISAIPWLEQAIFDDSDAHFVLNQHP